MLNRAHILTLKLKAMIKILNLKLATISKNQNIFAKGYTQYWPEENFVIEKVKNTV